MCYHYAEKHGSHQVGQRKEKERDVIWKKYRTDAACYYKKLLHFKAKGIEFTERAPPKNATELAERTAEETQKTLQKGFNATADFFKQQDEKFQI